MATPPTGNPTGRPSLYRPEYCELVQEDMKQGRSIGGFAGEIGVSRQTITSWMNKYPEFLASVMVAKTKRLRQYETALIDKAFTNKGGSATLIVFGLMNAGFDDWSDVGEHRHGGNIDVRGLSDEQLAALDSILSEPPP